MLKFEQQSTFPQWVYTSDPNEKWLDFQVDCLVQKQPSWSLPASIRLRYHRPELVLSLHRMVPLDHLGNFETWTPGAGLRLLRKTVQSLQMAEDDLFDLDQIHLSSAQIYLDPETQEIRLLPHPSDTAVRPGSKPLSGRLSENDAFLSWCSELGSASHFEREWLMELQTAYHASGIQGVLDWTDSHLNTSAHVDRSKPKPANDSDGGICPTPLADASGLVRFQMNWNTVSKWIPWVCLVVGHVLLLLGLLTLFLESAPAANEQLNFPVWIGVSSILLLSDLILLSQRIPHTAIKSLVSHIKRLFSMKTKQNPVEMNGQTVLIPAGSGLYRLGLLSIGLPGSPQETEGLRAYILVDEFVIGRDDQDCDLALPSAAVGRRHARINRREGSFFITDLGSKNGTCLDGRRLNKLEEYLLPDRCRLEFADRSFYFSAD